MRQLRQSGDTIVEVLIAIAIVSLTLGGAFVSSQRSFNVNQRAQERGEATKFVEQQLEQLKAASSDPAASTATGIFGFSGTFCLNNTTPTSSGSAACKVGPNNRYNLRITRGSVSFANTFTVQATWEKSGGGGNDQVVMVYRVYP